MKRPFRILDDDILNERIRGVLDCTIGEYLNKKREFAFVLKMMLILVVVCPSMSVGVCVFFVVVGSPGVVVPTHFFC